MTLELLLYSAILVISLLYAVTGTRSAVAGTVLAAFVLAYFIAARVSGFDIDMVVYAKTLKMPFGEIIFNPYYLREAGYWLTTNIVYHVIKSEIITFILFDLVIILIVIFSRKNFDFPYYYVGIYFTTFPSVLGSQNIYRQLIATTVLMLALSQKGMAKRIFWFAVSGIIHNVSFLFLPLVFSYQIYGTRRFYPRIFFPLAALTVGMIPIVSQTKSTAETGADLGLVYALVLLTGIGVTLFINRFRLPKAYTDLIWSMSYCFVITAASVMLLGSAQAERVGMVSMYIVLPVLIFYIETHVVQRHAARLALVGLGAIPTFLFPNALSLLLTAANS